MHQIKLWRNKTWRICSKLVYLLSVVIFTLDGHFFLYSSYPSFLTFLLFWDTRDWTYVLIHALQTLYHWGILPKFPLKLFLFWDRDAMLPKLAWNLWSSFLNLLSSMLFIWKLSLFLLLSLMRYSDHANVETSLSYPLRNSMIDISQ